MALRSQLGTTQARLGRLRLGAAGAIAPSLPPAWRVFGPLRRSEDLDPAAPLVALPDSDTAWLISEASWPTEGESALYVLRHQDPQGRSEFGVVCVRVALQEGRAVTPQLTPAWPDAEGWPVTLEGGRAVLMLWWERDVLGAGVVSVELLTHPIGGPMEVVSLIQPKPQQRWLRLTVPLPNMPTRYAWRITGTAGVVVQTGWSMAVLAPTVWLGPLEPVEVEQ